MSDTSKSNEKDWENGLKSEPVTTYVSHETKEVWKQHAENLDTTLSRFVEMMVTAGRSMHKDTAPEGYEDSDLVSANREIQALRDRIEEIESHPESADPIDVYTSLDEGYVTVDGISESMEYSESEVYEALQTLLDEEVVEYDPMRNAYRRTDA
ncbi:MAG: hypothetical protein SV253_10265 [Halobacteria archaeon]|nr:hypothetical protein [Halobacteria archaeon]